MRPFLAIVTTGLVCFGSLQAEEQMMSLDDLFTSAAEKVFGPLRPPEEVAWENEMRETVELIFQTMVPPYERDEWRNRVGHNIAIAPDLVAEGSWIPECSSQFGWPELLLCRIEKAKEQESTIAKKMDKLKKEIEKDTKRVYNLEVISETDKTATVAISIQSRGTSGTVKKDTLEHRLEHWILTDEWDVCLAYYLYPNRDKEKGENWEQLKETWVKRFNNVNF